MDITRALLLSVLLLAGFSGSAAAVASGQECVVVLHGLWRSELSMKAVEWSLEEAGYTAVNVTYPSVSRPIEQLAVIAVEEGVGECRAAGIGRIHFVTHSLGGILVRQYTQTRQIEGLERVVMLGPPNQGSQLADYVHSLSFLRPFEPVAIAQLGTGEESIPRRLGPVAFELGIIAGTSNSRAFLPGVPKEASDGTVAVAETVVPGMLDFVELPAGHSFMMWNAEVLAQIVHFLQHGYFDRSR